MLNLNDTGNKTKKSASKNKGNKFTISKYRYVEYNKDELLCSSSALLKEAFQLEKPSTIFSLPEPDNRLYHGPLGIKKK